MKFETVLWLPVGFKMDKECGFLASTFLGLDVRFNWRSKWADWGFTIGTIWRGVCFEISHGFWCYHESPQEFWSIGKGGR